MGRGKMRERDVRCEEKKGRLKMIFIFNWQQRSVERAVILPFPCRKMIIYRLALPDVSLWIVADTLCVRMRLIRHQEQWKKIRQ